MDVRPEVLTKLILHKRERITESLPQLIAQTGDEKQSAEKMARRARTQKEGLESKISGLKIERKQIITAIQENPRLGKLNKEQELELTGIMDSLSMIDISVEKFTENLAYLSQIIASLESDEELSTKYTQSVKANIALGELTKDYTSALAKWNEKESLRRKLESKFTKLSSSLAESKTAAEFWQSRLNDGFDQLLIDAKRVADGGPSSRQIHRTNRKKNINRGA
ncbi:MAG: hypothetical protein CMA66_00555 [Euryarchaeota archaeon]|jgi:hypothetical protein|nr:hypothetical protein [Euryarchaeota archaeon]